MRSKRIDDGREPSQQREPSGAPSLAFEIAFVLGSLVAAFLLYGRPHLADRIIAWLLP